MTFQASWQTLAASCFLLTAPPCATTGRNCRSAMTASAPAAPWAPSACRARCGRWPRGELLFSALFLLSISALWQCHSMGCGRVLASAPGMMGLSGCNLSLARVVRRRSAFVSPTSLGVLLFERPGVPPPAVHLTAPRLQGVMNQRIFRAIMGIVKGALCLVSRCKVDGSLLLCSAPLRSLQRPGAVCTCPDADITFRQLQEA